MKVCINIQYLNNTVSNQDNFYKEFDIDIRLKVSEFIKDYVLKETSLFSLPCTGKGICKQCKIAITGDISPITLEEKDFLSDKEILSGIRLACFTYIEGNVNIQLFEKSDMYQIVFNGSIPLYELKPVYKNYAIAIDIGTTTVVAALCYVDCLEPLKVVGIKNPQTAFGFDVISRIELSLAGKSQELANSIIQGIDTLIVSLIDESLTIDMIVITGNTAMLYLLTQKNPFCLSYAPFKLDFRFGNTIKASQIGILSVPHAKVYLVKCLSAFIGGDITTAILSSGLYKSIESDLIHKPLLLVDIGTNGEMVLCYKNKLYCCSTAAGPAFEGNGIKMGVQSIQGAIDSVTIINNQIFCSTITHTDAIGICGSGIIDAIAVFIQLGIIDKNGIIQESNHDFEDRIIEYEHNNLAIILEYKKNPQGIDIVITQKDIQMIQLAKSAICSGLQTLMYESGVEESDIDIIYIAGGFGNYINIQNASFIGLIPKILATKSKLIGNAALTGAIMLLQNKDFIAITESYVEKIDIIDLAQSKKFVDLYIQNMMFIC